MSPNFQNYPIHMNECGVVSVLNNKVQSGSSDDFIQFRYSVSKFFPQSDVEKMENVLLLSLNPFCSPLMRTCYSIKFIVPGAERCVVKPVMKMRVGASLSGFSKK
jgi:hypothetical protein